MKVRECMTRDVRVINPQDSIRQAAQLMSQTDAGAIPVGDNDRLLGMVTDRDIVVRAVCEGKGPDTPVSEVMTREVRYCFDDEDIDHVAENMAELQVRRLPVVNRDKRLVGIIAIGDIARGADRNMVGETLHHISQPGGQHSQSGDSRGR